jgi:Ca2+-binding EF-hand superfamily protein
MPETTTTWRGHAASGLQPMMGCMAMRVLAVLSMASTLAFTQAPVAPATPLQGSPAKGSPVPGSVFPGSPFPGSPFPGSPQNAANRIAVATWSEDQSRALFESCDRDGDLRLDLFEARAAIEIVDTREAFRRLDRDRDGFVDWPEFDRFYHELVRGGGTLHLRPFYTQAPAAGTAPRTPARQVIDLFDGDHSGALEPSELDAMLREFQLPPAIAAQMRGLDRDHDGKLDESELAPIVAKLQLGSLFTDRILGKSGASTLPAPWNAIDRNGDGKIDAAEFEQGLRRLDPMLGRWASTILKAADRDADGCLTRDELLPNDPPPATAATKPMVERSAKR